MTNPPPPPTPEPAVPAPAAADAFSNDLLAVDDLPQLDELAVTPLDPRHRTARLVGMAIAAVVIIAGVTVLMLATDVSSVVAVIGAVIVALIAVSAVMWIVEFRRLGYVLREHDVSYRSGLISQQTATVPFARVQHVSVTRGPLERMLGLATVAVSSAGPDISIPGLAVDEAERVKQLITERAGTDDTDPAVAPPAEPATHSLTDPFAAPPSGPPA